MSCEHCNGAGPNEKLHFTGTKCCWATAMEIKKFKNRVKHKYIFEVLFDLVVSVSSVSTDIISLLTYFYKGKYTFAILTMIPVLLPTLVFTNVYLVDEKVRKPIPKIRTISGTSHDKEDCGPAFLRKKRKKTNGERGDSTRNILQENEAKNEFKQKCTFHCSCFKRPIENFSNCFRGFFLCIFYPDKKLRKRGAETVRKSLQRTFKYGLGTIVLRFIACAWYIKAFVFGVKAYREPKKFMKIETPNNHWSYELLVRLEFLQAALENAPQCVIQLYALITQADEDKVLGMLTLAFSFIDFIRVSVYVHWDMDKGPVTAPNGCYNTILWKVINTCSWILIYSARSAAIALVFATSGFIRPEALIPTGVLIIHIILFWRILSKAEYGIAAQKIGVTVFISLFFLPELASSVLPAIPQFYYATILIENAFFILPWDGFDKEYCVSTGFQYIEKNRTSTPTTPPSRPVTPTPPGITGTGFVPIITIPTSGPRQITARPPTTEPPEHDCLIDPTLITLAVPTLTIIGIICRLVASQKMVSFRKSLPKEDIERLQTQNKLETSIANLFSKKWSRMTISQLASAFSRMLRKEVLLPNTFPTNLVNLRRPSRKKKISILNNTLLQADFLASQTFIRESFSLMTKTTRSYDNYNWNEQENDKNENDYNSDSEIAFRLNSRRNRPRISRSRNVSESAPKVEGELLPVQMPSGTHYLEMCWV